MAQPIELQRAIIEGEKDPTDNNNRHPKLFVVRSYAEVPVQATRLQSWNSILDLKGYWHSRGRYFIPSPSISHGETSFELHPDEKDCNAETIYRMRPRVIVLERDHRIFASPLYDSEDPNREIQNLFWRLYFPEDSYFNFETVWNRVGRNPR